MRSKEAFRETLDRLSYKGQYELPTDGPCSLVHFEDMYSRMTEDFSVGKVNRWLGYIQGVAVALDILSLDECKEINKSYSED